MELHSLPIIDWEASLKLAGNKKELADEILTLFLKKLPSDLSTLKALYVAKNYTELRDHLHKLHGALCYCGLPRLKTLISQLETDLKSNIMSNLPCLFDQLDTEVTLLFEHCSHQKLN